MTAAIIVLGAAVGPDGPSPSLRRRTDHAAALFHRGAGHYVVACGGLGRFAPTEASAMRDILIAADVPDHAIHCDHRSRNTFENLVNARRLLRDLNCSDVVIVTDRLHAPRARLTAWAIGLPPCSDSPPLTDMPIKTRLRRFRHEALSFPAYLLRVPWWYWRYRNRQT